MSTKLLTLRQAADHWQVTLRTIWNWRKAGKIQVEQTPGGRGVRIKVLVEEKEREGVDGDC